MRLMKHFNMKRFIQLFFFLIMGTWASAQTYNNEWIKFSQTYYKFKVGKVGIYRIPKTVLDAQGIGSTPVENFELWRNGVKVPFYSSVSTGALPTNGYLEFWGVLNDGKPDKPLYRDPAYQHTDAVSLQSDSSVYFLSVNTNQSGFRYADFTNNVASNTQPLEPYFMHTATNFYKSRQNLGFAAVVGEYVYSSSYDKGEFWSSAQIAPTGPLNTTLNNLYVNNAVPTATLNFGAVGNALNSRTVRVAVNGTQVMDTLMDYFNDVNTSIEIPTSLISSNIAAVRFTNNCAVSSDRIVISYFTLTYSRNFDFDNKTFFEFSLPADADGKYLEITNFNNSGVAPILYDLTNGRRLVGDISEVGKIKFAIPATATNSNYVLVNVDANLNTVASMQSRTFVDYSLAANEGDFVIITTPSLNVGTNGRKPVDEYAAYRSSAAGGSHIVKVFDVDELGDQFAFGISKHPLSIRNFVLYSRAKFSIPIKYYFLIGRGMAYNEYRANLADPSTHQLNLVPSFGNPASDNMLTAVDVTHATPGTPIGRLSVVRGSEIEDYLDKIKVYENTQVTAPNTLAGRQWMKNVVHVTGASDLYLGTVLCNYMSVYKELAEDTLFGAHVTTFCKSTTITSEQLSSEKIKQLFEEGISVLTYFGHSSATTLEFNIDNPENYNNAGKYPIFFVNGCNAGNFFTYYPQRLLVNETLSEKFVLAKERGSIAFVASTHFGIVNYLNIYLYNLYTNFGDQHYYQTLGELHKASLEDLQDAAGSYDYYARAHGEQITLHGDPALRLNIQQKPDYVLEESLIKLDPSFISIAEDSFQVKINVVNLGKAISDSIKLQVKRTFPDGSTAIIFDKKIRAVKYQDSVIINVPIVATRDKGNNRITATIDSDLKIDEVSESNNSTYKDFFIFEDEARPAYPYNFSIVTTQRQKLIASTSNPFSTMKSYVFEVDTTEFFNSSLKISRTVNSAGGIIEFDPGINYLDSTVYYWRVSLLPSNGSDYRWNGSSFIYKPGNQEGYNQSTFYQHKKSEVHRITIDSASKEWEFGERINNIFARNGVFPTAANQAGDFSVTINEATDILSVCGISNVIFNVIDPVTLKPWFNNNSGLAGQYGSDAICGVNRRFNFQYNILDTNKRRKVVEFMDLIPDGYYVVFRNTSGIAANSNTYPSTWMGDTSYLGKNNSMYHRLIEQGFTNIDSFNRPRAFLFIYRKNRQATFTPKSTFSDGINDRITLSADAYSPDTLGYVTSPKFGPAKAWKEVIWRGHTQDLTDDDNPTIDVIGYDPTGISSSVLYTIDKNSQNFDISSIDAAQYPYLQLKMRNVDSVNLTPYQLDYWRIIYEPVPEGAIAPNLLFTSKDTLEVGEPLQFALAFKNISKAAFDSISVKLMVLDKNNVQHIINLPKNRPIVAGDSIVVRFTVDTKDYPENNIMYVDVNPDNLQPEQYHFNNFMYRNFYVRPDKTSPVMDVTFDGVHILNRDIVSAKPHIVIKLKDEAKFLLLNDTALTSVQLKYPDGTLRTYSIDNDTLRFVPATSGSDNTATLEFNPQFLKQYNADADEYELIVKGKDRSGNKAGEIEYRILFRVITKPMVSNMLNFPNPFSTSTAFVFTLTGSEIPQQFKIQILTVTGKIVREITKDELGPLKIGRNITEFKWDGTDMYGQKLANGVYLYRVVTSLNGKRLDKYTNEGENTDRFFNNGYGKMYLMR